MNWGQALCRISPAQENKGWTGVGRAGWPLGYAGFSRVGRRDQQNPLTWKHDLMSMSGCQLYHGLTRWHQKLLFLNLFFAKSKQGTPHPRSETSTLQEMLRSLRKSCYVSTRIPAWCLPWVRTRMLCYTHLGLEHMEEERQSLECAKWGKTYSILWKKVFQEF